MVDFTVEWLAKQHEATTATKVNISVCDKGNKRIVNRMEEEKSCKFQVDPFAEKSAMATVVKRLKRDKRNA